MKSASSFCVKSSVGEIFIVLFAFLPLVGMSTPASASFPARYLVLEITRDGSIEPVFYRDVELASPLLGKSEQELSRTWLAARDPGSLRIVELENAAGEIVFRDLLALESRLRAEFHGELQADGTWEIETHDVPPRERFSVALRLPYVPGSRLLIKDNETSAFDLERLAATADQLPYAAISELASSSINPEGSPSNKVDLLIMGDGYTTNASFTADASALESAFFNITPYSEYKNYYNVSTLYTASTQQGADHPPFNAACMGDNPACCADTLAQTDPLAGTYVNTAFGGRYCAFNIHRLAVVNESAVFSAASAVPNWDHILVVINDDTYGGSGGSLSVVSTHDDAVDVARHEYGHSFTDLADEYDSAFPGFPICSDIVPPACEKNVTDQTVRPLIKWAPWIEGATPVPTPEGVPAWASKVGLFEGARYRTTGMYRPRDSQCLMHFLGMPFCQVCAQSYVLRLYDGGWGTPASGIDMIEPGSESPSPGMVNVNTPATFSVDLLAPVGGPPPSVAWLVNGVPRPGADEDTFVFRPVQTGTYTLEVEVGDTTTLVHPAMAGASLETSRTWTVNVLSVAMIFKDGFESGNTSAWSSTVP